MSLKLKEGDEVICINAGANPPSTLINGKSYVIENLFQLSDIAYVTLNEMPNYEFFAHRFSPILKCVCKNKRLLK